MSSTKVSPQIERFWHDLIEDIRTQRVIMPSLPEVAVRARQLLAKDNITSKEVTQLVALDPVLGSRIIRASNSPLARGTSIIKDLKSAVTRLGMSSVLSIVTSYAVEQLYTVSVEANSRSKHRLLQQIWKHSVHVAALSHVLASQHTNLDPEQAMLAGLIHDIGKLPIVEYASCVTGLLDDEKGLARLLMILHGRVGEMVLASWNFSDELLAVVRKHEDFLCEEKSDPSLLDVVTVANLLSHIGTKHPHSRLDWSNFSAFSNLELTPEGSIEAMHNAHAEIQAIRRIFAA